MKRTDPSSTPSEGPSPDGADGAPAGEMPWAPAATTTAPATTMIAETAADGGAESPASGLAAADEQGAPPIRSVIAAIAAISITGFSLAMSYPLFSVLLERMGASGLAIGLNAAAPAVAMLALGPLLPAALRRISVPTLLVLAALLLATTLVLFKPFQDIRVWLGLRFLMGAAGVAAFFGSELWIMSAAPPERRGLLIGVYGVCLAGGFVAGPMILGFMAIDGWWPFLTGAGLALASIIPIALAWDVAPTGMGGPPQPISSFFGFFRSDPSVMFAVLLFGVVEFGGFALMPVWALGVGLPERMAIEAIAWIALGNMLMQVPLGLAADRFDRKALLTIAAAICILGALLLMRLTDEGLALRLVLLLLGGLVVALYTVSLAELGARYSGDALSRGTGAFMFAYGLGALVSPPVMGAAMDVIPPHGMLWVIVVSAAAFLTLMILRYGRRRRS